MFACRDFFYDVAAYANSKRAVSVSSSYLNEQLKQEGTNIEVFSLHPGVVKTGLWTHRVELKPLGWALGWIFRVYRIGQIKRGKNVGNFEFGEKISYF